MSLPTILTVARPVRIEYGGAFYHVTARGNERKKVFVSKADYQAMRKEVNMLEAKLSSVKGDPVTLRDPSTP